MLKSYCLRSGRQTGAQKAAYNALYPCFCLPFSQSALNFAAVFDNANPVVCEIGFGMGSATAAIAESNPQINYLGVEVFKAGIGKLLWEIQNRMLKNIRIIEADAAQVFEFMIENESLSGIHVFFPDPWPKKRHHKRRLLQRPFTDTLAQKLKKEGYLYMVTDWEDYAQHALSELNQTVLLNNEFSFFAPPAQWRPQTRFERKGLLKQHKIFELYFKRRA
ncbi:MAG: tRNA (guanosine(46)-N7)-methyltransferase TrmB [Termitinemataceae bacterium]|nr:MAG: tRNA (guanosine(46)-N7)-methyltransferase TrmB [Termitinemataceae bacterium]